MARSRLGSDGIVSASVRQPHHRDSAFTRVRTDLDSYSSTILHFQVKIHAK